MKNIIGKKQVLCVLGGILFFVLAEWMVWWDGVAREGYLHRGSYGQGSVAYELEVSGLDEERVPLTVELMERQYTREEADQVFDQILTDLAERIKGDNPSLFQVRTDLNLITEAKEAGVTIRWMSEDPEIMDSYGQIQTGDIQGKGQTVYLTALLSVGEHRAEYQIPVTVYPLILSKQEEAAAGFLQRMRDLDEEQKTKERLRLPEEYDGKQLHYREQEDAGNEILLVLGVVLAVLCYAKDQMEEQEREKKRNTELLLDYAEVVFKLKLYIGAGMTASLAWKKMASDYEKRLQQGRIKAREVYEEMHKTMQQMQSGVPEGQAYTEFGKRCRLQPYLKLASLLEQNRKSGTKNLSGLLEVEMEDAWEQRKTLAKRMGEEAGTKLLLPLFLMLGVVMVIIMVPAMMSMT